MTATQTEPPHLQGKYHVAIIMDGNGRWATARQEKRTYGHEKGAAVLQTIVESCPKYGIAYLTVYAFSTDNWKRPEEEVRHIMVLFEHYLRQETQKLHQNNVVLRIIGERQGLPSTLRTLIDEAENLTQHNTGLSLQISLNYSARREILHAVQHLCTQVQNGTLQAQHITQEHVQNALWTGTLPDPHILIRTGGEVRLSNYLLWQLSYTELFFLSKFWPDFTPDDLRGVVESFQQRHRRFGA